ncbi:MAG: hypothetical protein OHK0039_10060 [Bacteroidia bacterium]
MPAFRVIQSDGSPARDMRVILWGLGEKAYGITDHRSYVHMPDVGTRGKIIIGGRTVYCGALDVDVLRI